MYIVFAAHLRGVVMKGKAAPCMKNALAGVGGDDGVYAVVFAASAAIFIYGDSRSSSTATRVGVPTGSPQLFFIYGAAVLHACRRQAFHFK